jgi:hypothetical protein
LPEHKKNQSFPPAKYGAVFAVAEKEVICGNLTSAGYVLENWPIEEKFRE